MCTICCRIARRWLVPKCETTRAAISAQRKWKLLPFPLCDTLPTLDFAIVADCELLGLRFTPKTHLMLLSAFYNLSTANFKWAAAICFEQQTRNSRSLSPSTLFASKVRALFYCTWVAGKHLNLCMNIVGAGSQWCFVSCFVAALQMHSKLVWSIESCSSYSSGHANGACGCRSLESAHQYWYTWHLTRSKSALINMKYLIKLLPNWIKSQNHFTHSSHVKASSKYCAYANWF